jgi:hypothetical protein
VRGEITILDAERIATLDVPVAQINTGGNSNGADFFPKPSI